MSIYFGKDIDGYLHDVANVTFIRSDKKVFYYDELSNVNFAPVVERDELRLGWKTAPVASVITNEGGTFTMTSGQFKMALFEMASGNAVAAPASADIWETKTFVVEEDDSALVVNLPAGAKNPYIQNMELDESATSAGKFIFTTPTITFHAGDVEEDDEVTVSYQLAKSLPKLKGSSAGKSVRGSIQAKWPIMSGAKDEEDSAVKGWLILTIAKAEIAQAPGFDTSYKSFADNTIEFTIMDPGVDGKATYDMYYKEKEAPASP